MEKFRAIDLSQGRYEVSTLGRVRNKKTRQILKAKINKKKSYPYVVIRTAIKSRHQLSIHRLVAVAFIPNKSQRSTVNHRNGVKTDNRVQNLEWATRSENNSHAANSGLTVLDFRQNKDRQIAVKCNTTNEIFPSLRAAARKLGVDSTNISACLTGHQKTAGGFTFSRVSSAHG